MTHTEIVREGGPCWATAMAVATFGFLVLGGVTLLIFFTPDEVRIRHSVLGSISGLLTLLMYPWQILDTKTRKHRLTAHSMIYRCGIFSRFEVEVPYRNIQAITVRQGMLQRMFGCGDVRASVHGVYGPVMISQRDINSVCIRSIKDFAEVADLLRQKMNAQGSHSDEGAAGDSVRSGVKS